jgi:hypothetical protein
MPILHQNNKKQGENVVITRKKMVKDPLELIDIWGWFKIKL